MQIGKPTLFTEASIHGIVACHDIGEETSVPTYIANCNRCGTRRTTFDVISANMIGRLNTPPLKFFELLVCCRECNRSNVIIASHANHQVAAMAPDSKSIMRYDGGIQDALTFHRFIDLTDLKTADVPEHIEGLLLHAYKEGATCALVGCHNAAAMMFRLCVDLVTRPLLPDHTDASRSQPNAKQRKDVAPRVAWLIEHGLLPESLRALAEGIREDGNDAAHHGEITTAAESEDLADFTRILIERLITEPKKIELAKVRREERRAER